MPLLNKEHFFIESSGSVYTLSPNITEVTGQITNQIIPTKSDFEEYGFTDLSLISTGALSQLVEPKLLVYSEDGRQELEAKLIPKGQTILPTGDIELPMLDKVNSLTLTATHSYVGKVKVAFSTDGGDTWRSHDGSKFVAIDLENIAAEGMTADSFNSLNELWTDEISHRIRFAYYIELDSSNDLAIVDKLEVNADFLGFWRKAIQGTDFDYKYSNSNLIVEFLKNGDYKVNYHI